jgi:hypothetical protein
MALATALNSTRNNDSNPLKDTVHHKNDKVDLDTNNRVEDSQHFSSYAIVILFAMLQINVAKNIFLTNLGY